jgi:hypothetical protein
LRPHGARTEHSSFCNPHHAVTELPFRLETSHPV